MRSCTPLLGALLILGSPGLAASEVVPFSGILEVRASVGASPDPFLLLAVDVTGTAEIDGGIVSIAAGELTAVVPNVSGFGGTLVNGAASFAAAGAGPGSSCPLADWQEICIAGGGFGGVMALAGFTHEGQALTVWGRGGVEVGSTASGVVRTEEGTLWTEGNASAWYYVPEIDPTPFAILAAGSFRGLPSTITGGVVPGFSLVTPMVVTASLPNSSKNVRAVATLRIDLGVSPVPIGGVGALALLLTLAGLARLPVRPRPSPARPG